MADNIIVTQGISGPSVAADDVAGVLYQRVKIAQGVDGSATDVSSSAPFPVYLATVTNTQPVSGTVTANAGTGTFAISAASLPLPAGAATAAKQPALGTAGSASTDVLTVQGIASMTALKVDGSAVTQPVSGTVSAAQSGTWNIANISGTISLPTGASTASNQTTLNTAIGVQSDAAVANGAAGSAMAYWRTIKDAVTDTTTASPVKIDQTTPGTTNAVSIQTPADVISFTPTLDTSIYAANDVLFATAAISGVTRGNDLRANLVSVTAIDKSKQNPAITLLFYQTNVTSAAANAANALSDADQINLLGTVDIPAASWKTWANNSTICLSGATAPNLLLEAASGTTTVYVVGILTAGTPTFANGDLVFKFGVVQS